MAKTTVALMLAVPDTPSAVQWYAEALGARVLWSMGSVAALEIDGAPFFLHEPVEGSFASPESLGATTVRVELFVDDPDVFFTRAITAGAIGISTIQNHAAPWGTHRQGALKDPFGHVWNIGDRSPLKRFPQ